MAEEALAFHIEGLVEDSASRTRTLDARTCHGRPENTTGVAILVAVKTDAPKTMRVNVTLPEDMLIKIDAFAEAHGYTRSGFLVQAAKSIIDKAAA